MKANKILLTTLGVALLTNLVGCGASEAINVKKDKFTVEYGKKISEKASTYVTNPEGVKVHIDSKFISENPVPCGSYKVTLSKNGEDDEKVTVLVKDTKKPKWIDKKDEYEVAKGSNLEDLTKQIKAIDKVGDKEENAKIIIKNSEKINFAKDGLYKNVEVEATDAGNNKISRKITVVVKDNTKVVKDEKNKNIDKKEETKKEGTKKDDKNENKEVAVNKSQPQEQKPSVNQQPKPVAPQPQPQQPTRPVIPPKPVTPPKPSRPVCQMPPAGSYPTRAAAEAAAQSDPRWNDPKWGPGGGDWGYGINSYYDPAYCHEFHTIYWFRTRS